MPQVTVSGRIIDEGPLPMPSDPDREVLEAQERVHSLATGALAQPEAEPAVCATCEGYGCFAEPCPECGLTFVEETPEVAEDDAIEMVVQHSLPAAEPEPEPDQAAITDSPANHAPIVQPKPIKPIKPAKPARRG